MHKSDFINLLLKLFFNFQASKILYDDTKPTQKPLSLFSECR